MEMPNLPTDNLYKFIALSGLLLFIFIIVSTDISVSKIIDESDLIETEIGEIKFESSLLHEKKITLQSNLHKLDSLTEIYKSDYPINNTKTLEKSYEKFRIPENREYYKFIYEYRNYIQPEYNLLERIKKESLTQQSLSEEIGRRINQIDRKNKLLIIKRERIYRYLVLGFLGTVISGLMMSFGFYFWYIKVQRYLDEKLKAEAKGINK